MIQKFFITLASSWLLNPLSVVVAQIGGLGNSKELFLVLLSISATAPFQLLLNDSIAVSATSGRYKVSIKLLLLLICLQFICALVALILLSSRSFSRIDVLVCASLLVISTVISYFSVCRYYEASLSSDLSSRQAMLYGAMPGVCNIVFYSLISIANQTTTNSDLAKLLFFGPFFAASAQYMFARSLTKRRQTEESLKSINPSTFKLTVHLFVLLLIAALGTSSRDSIAKYSDSYGAFVLVFLNILGTSVNTILKGKFLSANAQTHNKVASSIIKPLIATAICSAIFALLFVFFSLKLAHLAFFLCLQLLICAVVESARKI